METTQRNYSLGMVSRTVLLRSPFFIEFQKVVRLPNLESCLYHLRWNFDRQNR